MNKKLLIASASAALGISMVFGGAIAANAETSYQNFVVSLPRYQQSTYLAYQHKTHANTNADLKITAIGASYKVNAKTQNASGREGKEHKGLVSRKAAYSLPFTSAPAGSSVRLILTNDTWAVVKVNVSGSWKAN